MTKARVMTEADYQKLFVYTDTNGKPRAYDYLRGDTGTSHYGCETLEQVQERHPDTKIMTADEYRAAEVIACRIEPEEITKERFMESLECLPPLNMSMGTFAMSEFYTGNITSMFCQIGEGESAKYYHLRDEIMPAQKIIEKVSAKFYQPKEHTP